MPSRFVCPSCGASGRLPDGFAGDRIKCPACKTISPLDAGSTTGATPANPSSRSGPRQAARDDAQEPYMLETWEEAEAPPSAPVVRSRPNPAATPGRSPSRAIKRDISDDEDEDEDEAAGPPIAIIAGAAAAGILALVGGLVFAFGPWKSRQPEPERSARPQVETKVVDQPQGIAPPPQGMPPQPMPLGPGRISNVANLPGHPGGTHPGLPGGPAPGPLAVNGPGGLPPIPGPGGPLPGPDNRPPSVPGGVQAITPVGTATADDPVRRIQEATVYLNVQVGRVRGSGTGFVIRTEGNTVLIATNDHVANPHLSGQPRDEDPSRPTLQPVVRAVFRSGGGRGVEETLPAQVLAADGEENRDLAILQVRGLRNPPAPIPLSDVAEPKLLMPVIIYGFPFGNIDQMLDQSVRRNPSITVNRGSVSSMKNDQNNRLSHIQIDGSINPGNSGGPVVDEKGRLVGISVAKIENTNIGFAIPAAELSRMLDGRVGPIGLSLRGNQGGRALVEARARMIDPLNHVQSVQLLIAPAGSSAGGPDGDGNWPALTGAQTVELNRSLTTAISSFPLEFPMPRNRRLMVQAVYRLDNGRVVRAMPAPYVMAAGSNALTRDQGKPAITLPVARFGALGPLIDSHGQPAKDCTVQRDDSSLTIEVPAGVRLLSPQLDVHNAPMALADVEGDFIAQVRVTGNMIPGTSPPRFKGKDILPGTFQGAGLLLFQDSRNYIRVERSVAADRGKPALKTRALIEIIKGGRSIASLYPRIPDGPLYIRIQRIRGAVTCLFGPDGRRWISHEKLAIAYGPKVKLGLIASNMSRVPLSARFEEFVLITEQKDVDAEKSEP